jgi:hypothetical protein
LRGSKQPGHPHGAVVGHRRERFQQFEPLLAGIPYGAFQFQAAQANPLLRHRQFVEAEELVQRVEQVARLAVDQRAELAVGQERAVQLQPSCPAVHVESPWGGGWMLFGPVRVG